MQKFVLAAAALLFAGAGCLGLPEPKPVEVPVVSGTIPDIEADNSGLDGVNSTAPEDRDAEIETGNNSEVAVKEQVEKPKEKKVEEVVKNKVYVSRDHILRFAYPETYSVVPRVYPYSTSIEIFNNKNQESNIAEINIQLLETSDWEKPEYANVTTKPLKTGTEEVGGEGWDTYLMTNTHDHLFSVGCKQAECSLILKGIVFDQSLSNLRKSDLVGAWEGYVNAEEINLYDDGTFGSFLTGSPFESGTWTYSANLFTLTGDDGSVIMRSKVNEENGILYFDGSQVWTPIQ